MDKTLLVIYGVIVVSIPIFAVKLVSRLRQFIACTFFLFLVSNVWAQHRDQLGQRERPIISSDTSGHFIQDTLIGPSKGRVIIKNQGRMVVEIGDTLNKQYYYDNVRAVQDSTYFFTDSAIMTETYFSAMGNVTILQADTIQIFSDSLFYSKDSSLVELYGNVVFKNGEQELAGSSLFYDLESKVAFYQDTAILTQDGNQLQSKEGVYLANEKISYFYHDVILRGEEIDLTTDSLYFLNEEKNVIFLAPTRIKTKDADIYCESGFYNLATNEGEFSENAQYVSGLKTVIGDKITYNDVKKEVNVEGQTKFLTADGIGEAAHIYYSEITSDLILEGNAVYQEEDKNLVGQRIVYNEGTGEVFIAGNGRMQQREMIIEAANIDFNEKSGIGLADGDVVYMDILNKTTIRSDMMNVNTILNANRSYNFAGKPLMELNLDNDTMFLSCDTLITFEVVDTSDVTYSFLIADNDVRILKSDIQAVADSMIYLSTDSIFKLIDNPIMWSDSTQFNADTIHLFMKNDKLDRMKMISNAFIVNTSDARFFNQIKGKTINAFFLADDLDNFIVEGNAQSIYYVLDEENAYVGVNKTDCSLLKFYFGNNEISDIKGYKEVKQKMIPMIKANHDDLKLEGFRWEFNKKPTTLEDLLKD